MDKEIKIIDDYCRENKIDACDNEALKLLNYKIAENPGKSLDELFEPSPDDEDSLRKIYDMMSKLPPSKKTKAERILNAMNSLRDDENYRRDIYFKLLYIYKTVHGLEKETKITRFLN